MADSLKITYIRSAGGHRKDQGATIEALGLRKLNQTVSQPDNPCIRGMIHKVTHLLRVEEIKD